MFLKSLGYSETVVGDFGIQEWAVDGLSFQETNLIVGKNASGKTRLINTIGGLAQFVSGRMPPFVNSGTWIVTFERRKGHQTEKHDYMLQIHDRIVKAEALRIDGKIVLGRQEDGTCAIDRIKGSKLQYKIPQNQLACVVRRDGIQHPFLDHLFNWGSNLCLYRFGTEFGRNIFGSASSAQNPTPDDYNLSVNTTNISDVFRRTNDRFGHNFVSLIRDDMNSLGYDIEDIRLSTITEVSIPGHQPLGIAVVESGIKKPISQIEMSQGMYRALALVIQINANALWTQARMRGREPQLGDSPMIVIDDIGEGLDYERAKKLIRILMSRAAKHNMQLVMSSNDRFIMNDVDLKFWTILQRKGGTVSAINQASNPDIFEEFHFLGLNNFDFFAGEFFNRKENEENSDLR